MSFIDEILLDEGYTICPLHFPEYVHCDRKCKNCNTYIEFKKEIEKREENKNNEM